MRWLAHRLVCAICNGKSVFSRIFRNFLWYSNRILGQFSHLSSSVENLCLCVSVFEEHFTYTLWDTSKTIAWLYIDLRVAFKGFRIPSRRNMKNGSFFRFWAMKHGSSPADSFETWQVKLQFGKEKGLNIYISNSWMLRNSQEIPTRPFEGSYLLFKIL